MMGPFPTGCNLRWKELLTPEEILSWVNGRQTPQRLSREMAFPGVYRFIFPEARDGNSTHTPCYIGEAGNISMRLLHHFQPGRESSDGAEPFKTHRLRAGWRVRGTIRNSGGDFKLQELTIEGPVNFCGLNFRTRFDSQSV